MQASPMNQRPGSIRRLAVEQLDPRESGEHFGCDRCFEGRFAPRRFNRIPFGAGHYFWLPGTQAFPEGVEVGRGNDLVGARRRKTSNPVFVWLSLAREGKSG
jgi:hypothetical protein